MKVKERTNHIFRWLFVLLVGLFITGFASGASSVKAAESQEVVSIADEEAPLADSDNAGGGAFLLMGGMLLIILTVVITVVATFIVTAPIADEI